MALTLGQLGERLDARLHGDPDITASRVTIDSRDVGPGDVFVAVKGHSLDGHAWIADAVTAGCAAVVQQGTPAPDLACPCLVMNDTRPAPALAAKALHGDPDHALKLIGVTGTNGKTTTAYLMRSMLAVLRGGAGMLGTIRYETGRRSEPAPLTTPDGPRLYAMLAEMRDAGLDAAAMEVSSHALDQQRTAGLELDTAVLTNLSRDHLDYHGDNRSYLEAKLRILDLLRGDGRVKPEGVVALNADDPAFAALDCGGLDVVRWSTGWRGTPAGPVDVRLLEVALSATATRLSVDVRGRRLDFESRLVGRFNVENLVGAVSAGLALGEDPAACCEALAVAEQVPGRMERFRLPGGAVAVVDYAHTPDALAAVLASCRELTAKRLIAVFGCGGDRDRGKRAQMGAVAARDADFTWITSDNPRHEDPASICTEILDGYRAEPGADPTRCRVVVDRTEAIGQSLDDAREGDLVVIAGKGHEDYQIVGDRRLDLDDRRSVADWVEARHGN